MQEVVLADSVYILAGTRAIGFSPILVLALQLEKSSWLESTAAIFNLDRLQVEISRITELGFLRSRLDSAKEHWAWYLWYRTSIARVREASVPADKIYGIMGILQKVMNKSGDKLPLIRPNNSVSKICTKKQRCYCSRSGPSMAYPPQTLISRRRHLRYHHG